MPKPLELTVYPHVTVSLGPYDNPTYGPHPELFLGQDGTEIDAREFAHKRLTDPELAAEHQRAVLDVYRAKVEDKDRETALARMMTVIRFAQANHYDEESE